MLDCSVQIDVVRTNTSGHTQLEVLGFLEEIGREVPLQAELTFSYQGQGHRNQQHAYRMEGRRDQDLGL